MVEEYTRTLVQTVTAVLPSAVRLSTTDAMRIRDYPIGAWSSDDGCDGAPQFYQPLKPGKKIK